MQASSLMTSLNQGSAEREKITGIWISPEKRAS